jgi:hypothetical protein
MTLDTGGGLANSLAGERLAITFPPLSQGGENRFRPMISVTVKSYGPARLLLDSGATSLVHTPMGKSSEGFDGRDEGDLRPGPAASHHRAADASVFHDLRRRDAGRLLPGVPASPARPVLSPQDRRTRNLNAALSRSKNRKRLAQPHRLFSNCVAEALPMLTSGDRPGTHPLKANSRAPSSNLRLRILSHGIGQNEEMLETKGLSGSSK